MTAVLLTIHGDTIGEIVGREVRAAGAVLYSLFWSLSLKKAFVEPPGDLASGMFEPGGGRTS